MRKLVVFFTIVISFAAQAQQTDERAEMMNYISDNYTVNYDPSPARFSLSLTGNMAQFALQGRSLMGNSLEMAAGYALKPSFKLSIAVDQALSSTGGLSVMYTGIRTYASFAVLGNYFQNGTGLSVNGKPALSIRNTQGSTLGVDLGVDQYIFNGKTSITPATGMSTGLRYEFDLWKMRAILQARYGMLIISNNSGTLMTGGAGIAYRF